MEDGKKEERVMRRGGGLADEGVMLEERWGEC